MLTWCCLKLKGCSLHLDADIMPTKFIADFNECLLWLKKNKAGLAMDMDTLRALLLVAIQDEQFELVRDLIDRIPSTTPGAEPPRDAKDSGSARSHSTHLETSSSDRP